MTCCSRRARTIGVNNKSHLKQNFLISLENIVSHFGVDVVQFVWAARSFSIFHRVKWWRNTTKGQLAMFGNALVLANVQWFECHWQWQWQWQWNRGGFLVCFVTFFSSFSVVVCFIVSSDQVYLERIIRPAIAIIIKWFNFMTLVSLPFSSCQSFMGRPFDSRQIHYLVWD